MDKNQKETLSALEVRLVLLIEKHQACLTVGAVEQAYCIGRELEQVKAEIREMQKQGNNAQ